MSVACLFERGSHEVFGRITQARVWQRREKTIAGRDIGVSQKAVFGVTLELDNAGVEALILGDTHDVADVMIRDGRPSIFRPCHRLRTFHCRPRRVGLVVV